jgi:nuclear polyadenylated RNA-binding protein NAB2
MAPQQHGNGRFTNGHKQATVNGDAPRQENRRYKPKTSKPKSQEQVPLCKFGAGCTKPECPFAHPTPAAGLDGLVLRGEMCPDGRHCLNKDVRSIPPCITMLMPV